MIFGFFRGYKHNSKILGTFRRARGARPTINDISDRSGNDPYVRIK